MAGNVRFESSPANTDELAFCGSLPNVQRGNHSGASLDRSGSFRESNEGRMLNSASNIPRGSSPLFGEIPPISQCLVLEPLFMADHKYPKLGELRKVLGVPLGTSSEDGSFGANHGKLPHQEGIEDLKRLKLSLIEASMKARTRVTKLEESLHKLNKYSEALNSKRHQRSELLMNERSGWTNLKKVSQLNRNSSDLSAQRPEEMAKNAPLNKSFHSSVTELRGESQGIISIRQSVVSRKDRDLGRDGSESSDPLEEKIRRLPAGGEGWEKKMKRKRSIATVFARTVEGDGEIKRATQKVKNDSSPQLFDAQTLRSGSSNGPSGMNKSDNSSLRPGSNLRGFPKSEQEKPFLQRDFLPDSAKERSPASGNNKMTVREDASIQNSTPMTKRKGPRAPRSGPVMAARSPTNLPRASGGLESSEQSPSVAKLNLMVVNSNNNQKCALPSGSSLPPPMTQWGGPRLQKMPRSRTNVVSPILNHDEIPNSTDGDSCPKMTSMSWSFASGIQQLKVKLENVSSPARISEGEESGAGESHDSRLKEKKTGSSEVDEQDAVAVHTVAFSSGPTKKSRRRDEFGDHLHTEGRSGRGPSFARASSSSLREKLENTAGSKPHRSMRAVSDKSRSKSGRLPLKKLSERKAFTRPGKSPAASTPDFSGESDDDREERLAVGSLAPRASYSFCTGKFWKKMEPVFAKISSEDISYLEQQVKSSEELLKKFNSSNYLKGNLEHEEKTSSQAQYALEESGGPLSLIEYDIINKYGRLDPGGMNIIPITQRLLASLIVEDEAMDGDNHISCLPINGKLTDNNYNIGYDYHLSHNAQIPDRLGVERSCNGIMRKSSCRQPNCDIYQEEYGQLIHSERGSGEITENGYTNDEQYARMSVESRALLELHSIGLCPGNVPALTDGEDDPIKKEISLLLKKLIQQIDIKMARLSQLIKALGKEDQTNQRDLEQIAMDKHIEAAYKKQLATRACYATKCEVPKVPKQVAVAFTKRARARCHKFEDMGKSCFTDSPFIKALSAPPPHLNKSMDSAKLLETTPQSKPERGATGPLPSRADQPSHQDDRSPLDTNGSFMKDGSLQNRGKKKEVLLDDIGGKKPYSLRTPTSLRTNFSSGTKGKRSGRDRGRDPQAKKPKSSRQANAKGERKAKAKPKPKDRTVSGVISESSSDAKRETSGALPSNNNGNVSSDPAKEKKESVDFAKLDLPLGSLDDLDMPGLFNFDGDGLMDFDSAGLDIPMDNIADVFM